MNKTTLILLVGILFVSIPVLRAEDVAVNETNGAKSSALSGERETGLINAEVNSLGNQGEAEQTMKSATKSSPSSETAIFKLKFLSPQDVADAVRDAMGAASGGVMVHQQPPELEVTATPAMLEKIKTLIAALDQERTITLEVKAVQVDLNDEHRSGINWAAIVSDYKDFIASNDNRQFSTGTVSQSDLDVLLEALQTVGETKVYPTNAITIANGQDSDVRIKAFGQGMTVTIIPVSSAAVQSKEHQDRYSARLILSPIANSDEAVDIRISSSNGKSTVIHVKKDSLAVVGGIFTQTKLESTKKFPFLGDLPLVGVVFRDQSKQEHLMEDILFLTPRVMTLSDKH